MVDNIILRGLKKPGRVILCLREKVGRAIDLHIRKRLSFSYEDVASGWGIKGASLLHFSARLYREVKQLEAAIGSYHSKRSLEVGCGYGRLTPWIAEHSEQHYAVEPEPKLLKDARKMHPHVKFHQAKAQELPFPDGYFDLCVTWTVLQHIPPNELNKAVGEIKRVCTIQAVIILAEETARADGKTSWAHSLEEWTILLLPWKLVSYEERKVEETFEGSCGLVMRFERKG